MPERSTTRHSLRTVAFDTQTNAGLWLDKFLADQSKTNKDARRTHIAEVARILVPAAYDTFYRHWQQVLAAPQPNGYSCATRDAEVTGRMVVGLGTESVLETAIALQRTYGVPYVPGSALKGLAAAYTRNYLDPEQWGEQTANYTTLFGNTTTAGYVHFYDALFVPGTGKGEHGGPLVPDVITVHHADYYQGKAAPAEWDSPNPIPMLTATGTYLLALAGPPAWVSHTFDLLKEALVVMGIGAKTSSGYGRMKLVEQASATAGQQQAPAPGGPPQARHPSAPQIGDRYNGTIKEVSEQRALVHLEGLNAQRFVGIFERDEWSDKRYVPNNRARFEVIAIEPRGNLTLVKLKRAAPRAEGQ